MKQLCIVLLLLMSATCGCYRREDLATRLAAERKSAEDRKPPSAEAFHQAAATGDAVTVLSQLERGIAVDTLDAEGRTALQLASFDGHDEVVKLLLDRGANVNHMDAVGRTSLMFASSGPYAETAKLLIEAGAEINRVDDGEHFSALMFAAAEGNLDVVEVLLNAGADPGLKDIDGDSALSFARQNGHTSVVAMLDVVAETEVPAP